MSKPLIYLASASPRRRELLDQVGIAHEARAVEVDERIGPGETPADYVLRLAETKARALWSRLDVADRLPVLGADTTVALAGQVFGKPASRGELHEMLGRLGGHTHQVHTAVALLCTHGLRTRLSTSQVTMRALTSEEIDAYWLTGEPADKAGGYAVQGRAAAFISRIEGSYSGIVGLPLFETWELLASLPGLNFRGAAG
jgi:septum formation protein